MTDAARQQYIEMRIVIYYKILNIMKIVRIKRNLFFEKKKKNEKEKNIL